MDARDQKIQYDIEKVDFEWVKSTNNVKELKKALHALIEDKGGYVELEKAIQEKIILLDPSSKPPENKLSAEEQAELDQNLSEWIKNIEKSEKGLKEEDSKEIVINNVKSEKEKEAGNDYLRSKDYDLALKAYSKAIELNNRNSAAYFNRALIYIIEKKFEKAVEDCDKAIFLKNDYTKAYHRRAKAFIELKEWEKAIKDLEIVLEKNSENKEANSELKKCREESGKITGYRRINIVEVDEENEDDAENEEKEETNDEENNKIKPTEPKIREITDEEAKEMLDQEKKRKAENKKGKVLEKAGSKIEVINENNEKISNLTTEELVKALESGKAKGNDCFKSDDFDSAISEFSSSISLLESYYPDLKLPQNESLLTVVINLYNNRSLAFSKLDLNNEAIQDGFKVLKVSPNNAKALYRIGTCQGNRNNFKKAAKYMRKLLQVDPSNKVAKEELETYEKKLSEYLSVKENSAISNKSSLIQEISNPNDLEPITPNSLQRRVSFRDEDLKNFESKKSFTKDSFKKVETKFPEHVDYDDDLVEDKSDENEEILLEETKEKINNKPGKIFEISENLTTGEENKLKVPAEKKNKKPVPVQISQETINKAKEYASKIASMQK